MGAVQTEAVQIEAVRTEAAETTVVWAKGAATAAAQPAAGLWAVA